jgi:hypothetical protein
MSKASLSISRNVQHIERGARNAALAYGAFQLVTGSGSLTNCREHERTVSKQS